MKRFACGDVVPGCTAAWTCSSEDDLFAEVAKHASEVHGIVDVTPELVDAVRANIVAV